MSMLYLAPYVGTGTISDPFRPRKAIEVAKWSGLDIRPDPKVRAGFALFSTDEPIADALLEPIVADKMERLTLQTRTRIGNRLGLTLDRNETGMELVWRLLTRDHSKGWGLLRPARTTGKREIVIAGQRWAIDREPLADPEIIPLDPSDDFNRANSADLGANWTQVPGADNLEIVSNVVRCSASNSHALEYWNADTPSDDQWSEIEGVSIPSGVDDAISAMVRTSTGAFTAYYSQMKTNRCALYKVVAGSYAEITSSATNPAAGTVSRVRVVGTTISLNLDGVQELSSTDTTLTSGRWGIAIYATIQSGAELDNWEGGNEGSASAPASYDAHFPMAAPSPGPNLLLY